MHVKGMFDLCIKTGRVIQVIFCVGYYSQTQIIKYPILTYIDMELTVQLEYFDLLLHTLYCLELLDRAF